MSTRILIAAALLLVATDSGAQEVPPVVFQALEARRSPFCWGESSEPRISRDTVAYFPALTIYVERCEMYFGLPAIVAVGVDTSGVLYLLDSPGNVDLIELRYGRPSLDSTNAVNYVLTAAKLEGAIEWDAVLVVDNSHPDPRRLAPMYPTDGDCDEARRPVAQARTDERVWDVYFDVAGATSIDRVSALLVEGFIAWVDVERVCAAMHNP